MTTRVDVIYTDTNTGAVVTVCIETNLSEDDPMLDIECINLAEIAIEDIDRDEPVVRIHE